MISYEKIGKKRRELNPYTPGLARAAFSEGFQSGVRFAEAELKSIATDFAEWCTINAKPVTNGKALRYWRLGTYQSSVSYSTSELFAKFMAERGQG